MRKTLSLIFCFCASVCWGQYQTTYQVGVTDLSSYGTSGTNLWHQAGPLLYPVNGAIGTDMTMRWRKTDNSLWKFDVPSQHWSLASETDVYTKQIVIQSSDAMYRLKSSDAYCGTGPTFRTQTWNGTAWVNLTSGNDCKLFLAAASDGTLMSIDIGNANGGPVYKWNGSGWSSFGGIIMQSISVASSRYMCGISKVTGTAKLYFMNDSATFAVLSPQPSGTPAGCAMSSDNNEALVMFAWNTAGGVSQYDFTTSTWKTITVPNVGGAYVTNVITGGKGLTFMTMAGGAGGGGVYHYNVYAGFVMGTTSGQFNGCPVATCPNSVYHRGILRVHLPHGLAGTGHQLDVNPTQNLNLSDMDFSPSCDPFFGDPSDPECQGVTTASVTCSVSGTNFQAPPNNPPPPPPANPQPGHFAEYVGSYDGSTSTIYWTKQLGPNTYLAKLGCRASTNSCKPGTWTPCGYPMIPAQAAEYGLDSGPGASPQGAILEAQDGCNKHSIGNRKPGAWGFFSNYSTVNGVTTCTPITAYDARPFVDVCY